MGHVVPSGEFGSLDTSVSSQATSGSELWITDSGSFHRHANYGTGMCVLVPIPQVIEKAVIGNRKELRVPAVGHLNLSMHQVTRGKM